jgi:hypothetical protein
MQFQLVVLIALAISSASANPLMNERVLGNGSEVPAKLEGGEELPVTQKLIDTTPVPLKLEEITTVPSKLDDIKPIPSKLEAVTPIPIKLEDVTPVPVKLESVTPVPVKLEDVTPVPVKLESVTPVPVKLEDSTLVIPLKLEDVTPVPARLEDSTLVIPLKLEDVTPVPVKLESVTPVPVKLEDSTLVIPLKLEDVTPVPARLEDSTLVIPLKLEDSTPLPAKLEAETLQHNPEGRKQMNMMGSNMDMRMMSMDKMQSRRDSGVSSQGEVSSDPAIVKLCANTDEFKYYLPYPVDNTKYVQCDPWGVAIVKTCQSGFFWDNVTLECCSQADIGKSSVVDWSVQGVAVNSVSGILPESGISSNSVYTDIINGNFSYNDYIAKLMLENKTDILNVEQYKGLVDQSFYNELVKYNALFNSSQIRYDQVLNCLVEEILQDIYPDTFYLSSFNVSSERLVDVIRFIPNVLSYSKYYSVRYLAVFGKFQTVLDDLKAIFDKNMKPKSYAAEYIKLIGLYTNSSLANQTGILPIVNVDRFVSQDQIKLQLGSEYNFTLDTTFELYDFFGKYLNSSQANLKLHQELYVQNFVDAKIEGGNQVVQWFGQLNGISNQIVESLINYGFWYLTNYFAGEQF